MKGILIFSLCVAVAFAGNWNNINDKNGRQVDRRDAQHQVFIVELLQKIQNDVTDKELKEHTEKLFIDDKTDFKDLNKVYHFVTMLSNGWFQERKTPFSLFRERNIASTKALFDFFDTMTNWDCVVKNLIWARENINEYQFWYLTTLLVQHNKFMENLVLPAAYEVLPTQFFSADVISQINNGHVKDLIMSQDTTIENKFVIMQTLSNGLMGSVDNDGSNNLNDLSGGLSNLNVKIDDWKTMKKVLKNLKQQDSMVNRKTSKWNKNLVNNIHNNNRNNLNQGVNFDNNGEDRVTYFTEDMGLNNFYYFAKMENARIAHANEMYQNNNNKEVANKLKKNLINDMEQNGKVTRRGERYIYLMQQLLARFNLERQSNGLDNVQDLNLDGTIDNGVFQNLQYLNGVGMTNRHSDHNVKADTNKKIVQLTTDFENRFIRAIDQGYVQDSNGQKVNLNTYKGIHILGNLLQGNTDSVNNQYYRHLEFYYRLLLGGNYNDKTDFNDPRFVPTVMEHYETSMRDSVFWQMVKRITNIVNKYKNKLVGYSTDDVNFDGVKINNVKVDKLVTTFEYNDIDISNAVNGKIKKSQNHDSDENESSSSSSSSSSSESNESDDHKNSKIKKNQNKKIHNNNDDSSSESNETQTASSKKQDKKIKNSKNNNKHSSSSSSSSSSNSSSSSSESNEATNNKNNNRNKKNGNSKNGKNYRNAHRNMNKNKDNQQQESSKQVDYYTRKTNKIQIVGRTRQLNTEMFSVTIDVISSQKQNGIVRIFLGPKIGNKQQLNDNRQNFVELDQFVVKMSKGSNLIVRKSCNFKNVVGNPLTMETLLALGKNQISLMKNGTKSNKNFLNMQNINFDTNNNNNGFPHRLVLPKGTVAGEEFTIYVVVNGLDNINMDNKQFMYKDNLNFNNIESNVNKITNGVNTKSNSDDSKSNSDSNESGNQNDINNEQNDISKNMVNNDIGHGNFQKTKNGIKIHNDNNCNVNIGNGNGVLDIRSMGFPLDREILDVNGFITKNMFFKNVMIYHNNQNNEN